MSRRLKKLPESQLSRGQQQEDPQEGHFSGFHPSTCPDPATQRATQFLPLLVKSSLAPTKGRKRLQLPPLVLCDLGRTTTPGTAEAEGEEPATLPRVEERERPPRSSLTLGRRPSKALPPLYPASNQYHPLLRVSHILESFAPNKSGPRGIKHLEESLLKLQEVNEDLRCRDLQRAGENQELLRENLELKGQLERKAAVIATMLTEHEQLRCKIEKVRNKNLDLIDGRAALLAEFRQQLSREREMRLDLCKSMKAGDQPASESAGKKNAGRDETRQPRKPSFLQYQLKGEWLEASLERVKAKSSGEASQNVLGWLRGSLEGRDGDPSEASRHSLAEWLLASLINIHRGCPEAAREDVRAWLEVSITHLRAEGPEASALTVEDWLQASIAGLAKVEPADAENPGGPRKGWLERAIGTLKEGCGESLVPL
ncbi:uncharacterized protein M6D78_019226 [Vipera latastei]